MTSRYVLGITSVLFIGGAAEAGENLQQTLLKQETAIIEAIKQQDQSALENLLGQQAFAVTADGGRQTQSDLLRSLEGVTVSGYQLADVKCVEVTPDVGILTYRFTWEGTRDGLSVPATTVLATSTWVRRDGNWRSVFYQETPLPESDRGTQQTVAESR